MKKNGYRLGSQKAHRVCKHWAQTMDNKMYKSNYIMCTKCQEMFKKLQIFVETGHDHRFPFLSNVSKTSVAGMLWTLRLCFPQKETISVKTYNVMNSQTSRAVPWRERKTPPCVSHERRVTNHRFLGNHFDGFHVCCSVSQNTDGYLSEKKTTVFSEMLKITVRRIKEIFMQHAADSA